MMKYSPHIIILFYIVIYIFSFTEAFSKNIIDDSTEHKATFIPLPVIYYSPETHLSLGTIGMYLFKARKDPKTRTSNIDFIAVFTTNKQVIIDPIFNIFTKGEKYFIRGNILYTKFPEFFYGIGNTTSPDLKEHIGYQTFRIFNRFSRCIKPKLFVGIQYQYYNTFGVKFQNNTKYHSKSFSGAAGSITSGIGYSVVYDKRDNILTPTKNFYFEFSALHYQKLWGSQYTFNSYTIDFRRYLRIKNVNNILALQCLSILNFGNVPFKQMATIGGANTMRGYYNGRYRDKNLFAFQAEFRKHLKGKFGFTIFADMGQVTSGFHDLKINRFRYTAGGGIRYKLSKKENVNIRLDIGIGKYTQGFYINISEAF